MTDTPNLVDDEQKLVTVTCGNCYREKEINLMRLGQEIKQFFNEHKTRIGRTFCSMEAICIRYDFVHQQQQKAVRDVLRRLHHNYYEVDEESLDTLIDEELERLDKGAADRLDNQNSEGKE